MGGVARVDADLIVDPEETLNRMLEIHVKDPEENSHTPLYFISPNIAQIFVIEFQPMTTPQLKLLNHGNLNQEMNLVTWILHVLFYFAF